MLILVLMSRPFLTHLNISSRGVVSNSTTIATYQHLAKVTFKIHLRKDARFMEPNQKNSKILSKTITFDKVIKIYIWIVMSYHIKKSQIEASIHNSTL